MTQVSNTEMSLAFSMASLSNILMFPFTSKFIKLLGGPLRTIVSGLLGYFVRHVAMSYTDSYWLMVVLQVVIISNVVQS